MKNLIVFILFVPYIAIAQFKGTYETHKVRQIWFLCYNSLMQHRPDIPWNDHAHTCDCYVDKLRIHYTWEEFDQFDPEIQYRETFRMTTECLQTKPSIGDKYG